MNTVIHEESTIVTTGEWPKAFTKPDSGATYIQIADGQDFKAFLNKGPSDPSTIAAGNASLLVENTGRTTIILENPLEVTNPT